MAGSKRGKFYYNVSKYYQEVHNYSKSLLFMKKAFTADPVYSSTYANLLMKSSSSNDHELGFSIYNCLAQSNLEYIYPKIAWSLFKGRGCKVNNELGRKYYRKSLPHCYNDRVMVDSPLRIRPEVYSKDKIVIYGSYEDYLKIECVLLQFGIHPDLYVADNRTDDIVIDTISKDKLDDSCCIVATDQYKNELCNYHSKYFLYIDDLYSENVDNLLEPTNIIGNGVVIIGGSKDSQLCKYLKKMNMDYYYVTGSEQWDGNGAAITQDVGDYSELLRKGFNIGDNAVECNNVNNEIVNRFYHQVAVEKIEDIIRMYNEGRCVLDEILSPVARTVITNWTAVGDLSKISSLVYAYKKQNNHETIRFVLPPGRLYLKSLFTDIDEIFTLDQDKYRSLLLYLDMEMIFESERMSYFNLRPNYLQYFSGFSYFDNDYDMIKMAMCTSSDAEIKYATTEEKEIDKTMMIVPDANWLYEIDLSNKYKTKVFEILKKITNQYTDKEKILLNDTNYYNELDIDIKTENVSLIDLSSYSKSIRVVIGPPTGLFDFLILCKFKKIVLLYPSKQDYMWFDLSVYGASKKSIVVYYLDEFDKNDYYSDLKHYINKGKSKYCVKNNTLFTVMKKYFKSKW